MNKYVRLRSSLASLTFACLALAFATGCDSASTDSDVVGSPAYTANFSTLLNSGDDVQSFPAIADGVFRVENNVFQAEISAQFVRPNTPHLQYIYTNGTCPSPSADTNEDGFIDAVEGAAVYGDILLPLDSDLSDQGAGEFPAPQTGTYQYSQEINLNTLVADLRAGGAGFGKLGPDEDLNLTTRSVVIHGVNPDLELPETVASFGGLPAQATLPIACSTIVQVN